MTKIRLRRSLLFLLFFSALIWGVDFFKTEKIEITLDGPGGKEVVKIGKKDALVLEEFFRKAIFVDQIGYTLAGIKPMSTTGDHEAKFIFNILSKPFGEGAKRAWRIWKKYEHHFENRNLSFWIEESPWMKGRSYLIFLADKTLVEDVVRKNIEDFKRALNREDLVDGITLIHEAKKRPFFSEVIQKNHALLGMMLGFGRENAWYFQKHFNRFKLVELEGIWEKGIQKPKGGQNIDMPLPQILGDGTTEESQALKQKYIEAREKLIRYFEGKDFLEAALNLYKNGKSVLPT